jgi:hypothetical protein
MSVCVYSVFVLFLCVGRCLVTGWSPVQGVYLHYSMSPWYETSLNIERTSLENCLLWWNFGIAGGSTVIRTNNIRNTSLQHYSHANTPRRVCFRQLGPSSTLILTKGYFGISDGIAWTCVASWKGVLETIAEEILYSCWKWRTLTVANGRTELNKVTSVQVLRNNIGHNISWNEIRCLSSETNNVADIVTDTSKLRTRNGIYSRGKERNLRKIALHKDTVRAKPNAWKEHLLLLTEITGRQTDFMELSHSWADAYCAVTQELPNILWSPKVHYHVHKRPPLVPILSRIIPVHITPSYLSKIHFNIIHSPTS